jgi:hypothetical protein
MNHDPLCYWHDHYQGPTPVQVDPENDKWEWIDVCNDCDLIAKAREDERSAAVPRVEALASGPEEMYEVADMYWAAVAAIKGEINA